MTVSLPAIPLIDVRCGSTVRHAQERPHKARALRDDCLAWFPSAVGAAMPVMDRLARRWLVRSSSPYIDEIEQIAAALGFPGIWFLNGSYQWGCTALAAEQGGVPWIFRTLDWPFPGLGRHVEVAHMRGRAGEFINVTWPGYVGALTAMAPGRFAAAINQAPLWRRTRHPWLRSLDIVLNAVRTWRHVRHIPPDQLLRQVFETAGNFQQAKEMLEAAPVARPVIFTLIGCAPGEQCVIERTEEQHATRDDDTCAANDWLVSAEPWEARIGSDLVLSCTFEQALANSRRRREALLGWRGRLTHDFAWVEPPILNFCTRLAVEMCAVRGRLRLVGYEVAPERELPQPVTSVFEWPAVAQSAASVPMRV